MGMFAKVIAGSEELAGVSGGEFISIGAVGIDDGLTVGLAGAASSLIADVAGWTAGLPPFANAFIGLEALLGEACG